MSLNYLVIEHLNALAAEDSSLSPLVSELAKKLNVKTDSDSFNEYSYYPAALNDIVDAGAARFKHPKDLHQAVEGDEAYTSFLTTLQDKGFFNNCEVNSVEYNQRLAKVITKYLDKKATQQVDPEVKAEEFKEIGNKALLAKDFETAMANYSSAIDQSPNGPNTHVYYANRAYAQVSLKNYEAAIGDCEASISLSNDYKKAHARLCQATYLAKRYEDCVRACEQCLELDPSDKAIQDYKMKAEGQLGGGGSGVPGIDGLLKNPNMKKAFDQAGGMSGIQDMMKDPAMMKMAQDMMKDPAALQNMMGMLGGGGAGGMPDLSSLAGMLGKR